MVYFTNVGGKLSWVASEHSHKIVHSHIWNAHSHIVQDSLRNHSVKYMLVVENLLTKILILQF